LLSTTNLPWQLTQPPGVRPSGTFSKSWWTGRWLITRTRARAANPSALASTKPNWPGRALSTLSRPSAEISPLRGGGPAAGPLAPEAGLGAVGGGAGAGSDHW